MDMDTKQLLDDMTSSDEETRALARQELVAEMNDEIAQAFLDIAAGNAAAEARADTIIGLGPLIDECGIDYDDDEDDDEDMDLDFGNVVSREMFKRVVDQMRAIYENESQPKLVRRRALEVLVRDAQPWQAEEARKHFASSDPEWKRTAVFAMGKVPGFESEIAEIVGTAEGDLLYEAVRAAGMMEVKAAAKRIRSLAEDEATDIDLRIVAILALPHVDARSFELLDELSASDDEDIAAAAQEGMDELMLAQSSPPPYDE